MSSKLSQTKSKNNNKMTKSDVRFYKMSSLFFLICAIVLFVLKIMDSVSYRISTGKNLSYELYTLFRNPVYIIAVLILLIASAAWLIVSKVKKYDESYMIVSSINALSIMLYIAGFSAFYGIKGRLDPTESVFIIAVTVALALIYYISKIYKPDFLIFSIENALLALLLYKYQYVTGVRGITGKVLLIIAFVAIGFVAGHTFSNIKSRIQKGKRKTLVLFPYFVSLVIWSVFMFATGIDFFTTGIMLSILLVQYIAFAIVYTIKLIKE